MPTTNGNGSGGLARGSANIGGGGGRRVAHGQPGASPRPSQPTRRQPIQRNANAGAPTAGRASSSMPMPSGSTPYQHASAPMNQPASNEPYPQQDPFAGLEIPSSNAPYMGNGGYAATPQRGAGTATGYPQQQRYRSAGGASPQHQIPQQDGESSHGRRGKNANKMTARQKAQIAQSGGYKPSLFLRMRMAMETAGMYIREGEVLNLFALIGDWVYRHRIPVICISMVVFLLIGFFLNRYVSWGGGLALVLAGAAIGRIDDDHEGFPFILAGILVYLIPFIV